MKQKALCYGELLWDLLPSGPILGGAPANLAYRLQSLGIPTHLVTRVGDDDLGRRARDVVDSLGLDVSGIQTDAHHPTGTVPVTFRPDGAHEFEILPGVAYDFIETSVTLLSWAQETVCLCFGTLVQRELKSRETLYRLLEATSTGLRVCDVNLRRDCYSGTTLRASLERATVLKLNEEEILALSHLLPRKPTALMDFCEKALGAWKLQHCVVTLGARGALAASASGETCYDPGHEVPVVDSIGSGDAFTAGFVAALLGDLSLTEACRRGNAMGALVASTKGATQPVSDSEIDALLEHPGPRNVDPALERHAIA